MGLSHLHMLPPCWLQLRLTGAPLPSGTHHMPSAALYQNLHLLHPCWLQPQARLAPLPVHRSSANCFCCLLVGSSFDQHMCHFQVALAARKVQRCITTCIWCNPYWPRPQSRIAPLPSGHQTLQDAKGMSHPYMLPLCSLQLESSAKVSHNLHLVHPCWLQRQAGLAPLPSDPASCP